MTDRYRITLYVADREKAAEIVRRLGAKLVPREAAIESVEEAEAVGMTRTELALTILLSFSTSVSANLATPTIQQALDEVRQEIGELVDFEVLPAAEATAPHQGTPPADPGGAAPEDGAAATDPVPGRAGPP